MPIKKITECLSPSDIKDIKDFTSQQLGRANKSHRNFITSCLIFLILIVYMGVISYKIYTGMQQQFSVSEEDSKKCLVDFQKKNCNALRLDGAECSQLYDCVQKQK